MARVIKASGETIEVSPKNGSDFSLEELQGFVGGYIQIVGMPEEQIVLDEEGKLKGKPLNKKATEMALRERVIFPNDYIVGDVLICSYDEIL